MNETSRRQTDRPYYEAMGLAHDFIVRCCECQALVTCDRIAKLGCCACGCRRVREVTTLSGEEFAQIESGAIDFLHRALFLKEFARVE